MIYFEITIPNQKLNSWWDKIKTYSGGHLIRGRELIYEGDEYSNYKVFVLNGNAAYRLGYAIAKNGL